jgi:hypothetical protein
MGLKADLEAVEYRKLSYTRRELNSDLSAHSLSLYRLSFLGSFIYVRNEYQKHKNNNVSGEQSAAGA